MAKQELVLVPGLLCTARLWRDQVAGLSDIAHITIPDHHLDDNLPAIARRFLADAPPRFALAGLSMGGYVAFEIMRQAPERVTRIALLDTRSSTDAPEDTQRRKDLLVLVGQGRFTGIHKKLMPLFIHPDRLDDRELTDTVAQMAVETGANGFVNQTKALMARADADDVCRAIKVPALVLCGRQDAVTPLAMHEHMAALIPHAELKIIEDCGHLTTLERPEAVTRALRAWLAA